MKKLFIFLFVGISFGAFASSTVYFDENTKKCLNRTTKEKGLKRFNQELLKGKNLDCVNFKGISLRGSDLSGKTLRGAEFDERSDMSLVNFNNSDLTKVKAQKATFIGAKFEGSNTKIVNVDFSEARLNRASFKDAFISNVTFNKAYLQRAKFIRSKIWDSTYNSVLAIGASFANAKLTRVKFDSITGARKTRLKGTKFNGATISKSFFKDVDLRKSKLSGITATTSDFTKANLRRADLHKAKANGINFTAVNLQGALLTSAELKKAIFNNAILTGANLSNVKAQHAQFQKAKLEAALLTKADLSHANLKGASFYRSNACNANFSSVKCGDEAADFTFCDLTSVTMEKADLQGANFNDAKMHRVTLKDSKFQKANFSNVRMNDANCSSCCFEDCDISTAEILRTKMVNTKLGGANLEDTDLTGVHLLHCDLKTAKINDGTIMDGVHYTDMDKEKLPFPAGPDADIEIEDFEMQPIRIVEKSLAGVSINDNTTSIYNIPIDITGKIYSATTSFKYTHGYPGEIRIDLVSPDKVITLCNKHRFKSASFDITKFLKGLDLRGTWKLKIYDMASGGKGTMDSFKLKIYYKY